jgi:hypothetical protein
MKARLALGVWFGLCLALVGCQGPLDESEGSYIAIPPGKADNYLSPVVQEYDVEGPARVELSEEDAALVDDERTTRVEELVKQTMDRITSALESKLKQLSPEEERKEDDGLIVFMREFSTDTDDLTADGDAAYTFTYRAEVAGTRNLLPFEDGTRELKLEVGSGDDKQTVTLGFKPSRQVKNTYPRYRDLFKDGLDIYIHYGGDYNERRWDVKKSKALYDKLKGMGFQAPTESYDELALDSEPFKGKLDVAGEEVEVRVKVVHPEMVGDDELDELIDAYKANARSDVVVYSGHASESTSYSGIVVHYNPRKALPGSAFKDLDLPDQYQIFVFSGCYTYTGYADQLLKNPKKTTDNVDIVTAVSSTPLSRDIVSALLRGLLDETKGTWFPHTWEDLLRQINSESERSWRAAFGVHGLEQNPKISPLADPATVGETCTENSECPGIDNLCVLSYVSAKRQCGAACTDSSGCPDGSQCWWSFADGLQPVRQCVKIGN